MIEIVVPLDGPIDAPNEDKQEVVAAILETVVDSLPAPLDSAAAVAGRWEDVEEGEPLPTEASELEDGITLQLSREEANAARWLLDTSWVRNQPEKNLRKRLASIRSALSSTREPER